MRDAFKKMLWFYGFELKEEDGELSVGPYFHYMALADDLGDPGT